MVPGSSAVEQPAVNRLVAGSNPARGAKHLAEISIDTKVVGAPFGPLSAKFVAMPQGLTNIGNSPKIVSSLPVSSVPLHLFCFLCSSRFSARRANSS